MLQFTKPSLKRKIFKSTDTKTPPDILRDFESHARSTTRQLSEILKQQKNLERKRSLNRDEMALIELRRENQGRLKFRFFANIK